MGTIDAASLSSDWDLMAEEREKEKQEERDGQYSSLDIPHVMPDSPDPSGTNDVDSGATVDRAREQDRQAVAAYKQSLDTTGAGNDPSNDQPAPNPGEDRDTTTARDADADTSDYSEYSRENDPRRDARNWTPAAVQEELGTLDVPEEFWTSSEAFQWVNQETNLPTVSGGVSSSRTSTFTPNRNDKQSVTDPDPTKDRDQSGESRAERRERENAATTGGDDYPVHDSQRGATRGTSGGGFGGGGTTHRPPQQDGGGGVLGGITGMALPLALLGGVGVAAYYGATYMGWL